MPRDAWKHLPRLFVDAPLTVQAAVLLDTTQRHYLTQVLRRPEGCDLLLFNGRDGEWQATLTLTGKKAATAHCVRQTRPQAPEPDLMMLFAPIKRDHLDYMVQKASELGVALLRPVLTQHTATGSNVKVERLTAIAREAAEQCERLSLPVVVSPVPLADALSGVTDRPLFACLETGDAQPAATAMMAHTSPRAAILTGPEGGFSAEEMQLIRRHPHVIPVSLGPRILRADTAALAALTLWQALRGDWSSRTL